MRILIIVLSLLLSSEGFAQDSSKVLTYESFMDMVIKFHPYSFQANIVQSMGEAGITRAKGAFDPKLFGSANQKYFEDKQYYSHINGGIKIPTWFGISAEAGYELNDGVYLNPEQRLPNSGLWYAGLRIELGNGLIIDQRRAEFEKAKLYQTSSEFERTVLLNQLQRDASIAYYNWNRAYQKVTVYQLAFDNARVRLDAVISAAEFGDRPDIDTVEASLSLQSRLLSLQKARTYFENAELKLETYLWQDGFIPLELENIFPESMERQSLSEFPLEIDSLVSNHPILKMNELELDQKKVDLKLKKEQLKPNLTLKYNALSEPINGSPIANYSPANYRWGAGFSYPILTRKERGGVELAKLKLQDQELKYQMTTVQLEYGIQSAYNNYLMATEQLETASEYVLNSEQLYEAEKSLFELGESSVFMINSRENLWLKSRIQLIEVQNQQSILETELKYQLMLFGN